MTGYIDSAVIDQSVKGSTINLEGRDLTQDLLDSTLDSTLAPQISGGFYLDEIAQKLIDNLGIPIKATYDSSQTRPFFKQDEFLTVTLGDTGYNYLEKYAKKAQVYLNTDPKGNINITSAVNAPLISTKLLLDTSSNLTNNILHSTTTYDSKNLFSKYKCHAQQHKLPIYIDKLKNASEYDTEINNITGLSQLKGVRTSRIFNFVADTPMNLATANKRAALQANFSRSNYFQYRCKVVGFTYDGITIWRTNIKVHVLDKLAGVNAILLVSEVHYVLSATEGETTELILVYPDAFTLKAERTEQEQQSQKVGDVYNSTQ